MIHYPESYANRCNLYLRNISWQWHLKACHDSHQDFPIYLSGFFTNVLSSGFDAESVSFEDESSLLAAAAQSSYYSTVYVVVAAACFAAILGVTFVGIFSSGAFTAAAPAVNVTLLTPKVRLEPRVVGIKKFRMRMQEIWLRFTPLRKVRQPVYEQPVYEQPGYGYAA